MGAEEGSLPPQSSGTMATCSESGARCRRTANIALRAFIDLMQEAAVDGWVSLDAMRRIGAAVMDAGGPLAAAYTRTEAGCEATFAMLATERQRVDFLGRLVTARFAHLLDLPGSGIERKNLAQFFAAMRMVLGEDIFDTLKVQCAVLVEAHREAGGLVDWEAYYDDSEARQVVEQVLVTMARSFRRFEPRCDWFLIIMNSSPSSISLGSNAFVPKKAEDKVTRSFTEVHLYRLFDALFADMRPDMFDAPRRAAFIERWGTEPEKIFGPLFVELRRLHNHVGG